jgi:hypothetical protein
VKNIVAAEHNIFPALLVPFVGNPFSQLVIARGGGGMRFRREDAMPRASFIRRRNRLKRFFELALGCGVWRRKAKNRRGWRLDRFLLCGNLERQQQESPEERAKSGRRKTHCHISIHKK